MRLKSIFLMCLMFMQCSCSDKALVSINSSVLSDKEQIQIEELHMSVEGKEEKQEVKPERPSGYYEYYEKHDGYHYYVLYGEAGYDGNELQSDVITIVGKNDKNEYDGIMVFSDKNKSRFIKTVNKNEKYDFFIIFLMKDGDMNIDVVDFYYNEEFSNKKDTTFDFRLRLLLDDEHH